MPRNKRFTIYDMMEDKGAFESNPANVDSRDSEGGMLYTGPVQYPKMLYHPKGEEREIESEREEVTSTGRIIHIPARYELVHCLVQSEAEERRLRADGWHDHPAKAMAAAGKKAPVMGGLERLNSAESELARLRREKEDWEREKAEMQMRLDEAGDEPSKVSPSASPSASSAVPRKQSTADISGMLV